MNTSINPNKSTKKKIYFKYFSISIFIIILCYIIMYKNTTMTYMTNDDASIQSLLSGNRTGTPFITHQFIHIFLGKLISSLYIFFPSVQWWYIYSHTIII